MSTPRTVAFHTLGCKLNFSESSALARRFEAAGYRVVPFEEGADICVINTCSVTDFADRKCRQVVRRALRQAPHARIVVTGCYAQLKPHEIAQIEGVDLVLGAAEKFRILEYVEQLDQVSDKALVQVGQIRQANEFVDAFSFGNRTRSFLKVQDGCDYKCTFCTIPQARGRSRSDTVAHVVANARKLAAMGAREIVLTGVNLGDFGKGTAVREDGRTRRAARFIDLIRALEVQVEGIARFRISSIEPNLCSDQIIEFVASSKRFVPHFHMPLQSGNDKQLRQMARRYTRASYAERVARIRQLMPHACIGVDVIVGFPGETEADFRETYRFLSQLEVSYLHVFTYSERPGTPAATMPGRVPMEVRRMRNEMLTILSEKKRRHFYEQHLGQVREVLFEHSKQAGRMSGFTDNYIRVDLPFEPGCINTVHPVRLEAIQADGRVAARLATPVDQPV